VLLTFSIPIITLEEHDKTNLQTNLMREKAQAGSEDEKSRQEAKTKRADRKRRRKGQTGSEDEKR